jgi:hypothetical protein
MLPHIKNQHMNLKRKTLGIITIFFALLISSCGNDKYDFAGEWLNTENPSRVIKIKKNGDSYLIDNNGKLIPAELQGDFLVISPTEKAVFNKETARLIVNGTEYLRMDGDYFLGNYSGKGSYLTITKDDDKYKALLSFSEFGQLTELNEENYDREFEATFEDAKLVGRYYGSDEGGTFEIKPFGKDRIKYFANVNNDYTYDWNFDKSDYKPMHKSKFAGSYAGIFFEGDDGSKEADLIINKTGKNSFEIFKLNSGSSDNNWKGTFKNGYISCRSKYTQGMLRFKDENTLEVQGLFNQASHDQFDFIKKTSGNSPTNSTNTDENLNSNNQNNSVNKNTNSSSSFYVINTNAVKKESTAKKGVENLKSKGYEAGYLWIPEYKSLSGAEFYSVYVGPFYSQFECEKAVEEYRKVDSKAYALLVSQENKRVEIRGIGKVKVIEPYHK